MSGRATTLLGTVMVLLGIAIVVRTVSAGGGATAFGLSKADAVKAVTLRPAQIPGLADRFGSIEVGKAANLVVTTGDLFEAKTDTKYLFIDGRPVPLDTKHSELNKIFEKRP